MNMKYRKLPHGTEMVSEIGLGMGSIHQSSEKEITETVRYAIESGINYFDMVPSEAKPFVSYGEAFKGVRDKVILQMHFGAVYDGGKYGWTQDLGKIKKMFSEELKLLHTDYTDFGFVHCIDELADSERAITGGLWDYMKGLKEDGVIRHLGLSSHNPAVVRRFLETGLIDMVMFSINPAYDYTGAGELAMGSSGDRMALYRECEKEGVGLSVMKPFGGGQLLSDKTSPFKKSLTRAQCIRYALDRPGVLTVLPGIRGLADLKDILAGYGDESAQDYALLGKLTPVDAEGICVYCNHCQPCPMGLDVGLINKYYDLALAGDEMAKDHYRKLSVKAGACVKCGHCESRCPFHVKQEARMEEIAAYFGE